MAAKRRTRSARHPCRAGAKVLVAAGLLSGGVLVATAGAAAAQGAGGSSTYPASATYPIVVAPPPQVAPAAPQAVAAPSAPPSLAVTGADVALVSGVGAGALVAGGLLVRRSRAGRGA